MTTHTNDRTTSNKQKLKIHIRKLQQHNKHKNYEHTNCTTPHKAETLTNIKINTTQTHKYNTTHAHKKQLTQPKKIHKYYKIAATTKTIKNTHTNTHNTTNNQQNNKTHTNKLIKHKHKT